MAHSSTGRIIMGNQFCWIQISVFCFMIFMGIIISPAMANYQSQEGRWMQQDPMQYVDGLNLYQYVNSCPLLQNDYLGLFSGKTHKQLSREAFNSIINTGPEQYSEKCKS